MKKLPEPQRLDQLLVALGLFASRSRSRDAIQRGTVKVDGKVETRKRAKLRPGQKVQILAEG